MFFWIRVYPVYAFFRQSLPYIIHEFSFKFINFSILVCPEYSHIQDFVSVELAVHARMLCKRSALLKKEVLSLTKQRLLTPPRLRVSQAQFG